MIANRFLSVHVFMVAKVRSSLCERRACEVVVGLVMMLLINHIIASPPHPLFYDMTLTVYIYTMLNVYLDCLNLPLTSQYRLYNPHSVTSKHLEFQACLWYGIGSWTLVEMGDSWIGRSSMEQAGFADLYAASMHWTLTQFTPATNDIAPNNAVERRLGDQGLSGRGVLIHYICRFISYILC